MEVSTSIFFIGGPLNHLQLVLLYELEVMTLTLDLTSPPMLLLWSRRVTHAKFGEAGSNGLACERNPCSPRGLAYQKDMHAELPDGWL